MIHYFLWLLFLCWPMSALSDVQLALDNAPIHREDMQSIKRGAKFFATNCMACHSLAYLRYNQLAIEAGITYEKMPLNVKWPGGIVPPDLSLEANIRGVNWVYTYLHSFYADPARPTGFNNLLLPNTMMPGILVPFQGQQMLATDIQSSKTLNHMNQWYDFLTLQKPGLMSPPVFDETIADVVNFLDYAAEPFHEEEVNLGKWVIGFLVIFFVLAYCLKREYWKDIEKKNK